MNFFCKLYKYYFFLNDFSGWSEVNTKKKIIMIKKKNSIYYKYFGHRVAREAAF